MNERRFVLHTPQILEHMVEFLRKNIGGDRPLEVLVRPYYQKRSTQANARLWALHAKAAAETGYSSEEMHEEALCRFYGYEEKKMPGGWIKRYPLKRSSSRNTKEFRDFMESTEAWYIAEFGVWLDQREAA